MTGQIPPVPVDATFAARFAVPDGFGGEQGFRMLDLRGQTPKEFVSGDYATYTGFRRPSDSSAFQRIDFVFAGSHGNWYVPSL